MVFRIDFMHRHGGSVIGLIAIHRPLILVKLELLDLCPVTAERMRLYVRKIGELENAEMQTFPTMKQFSKPL